MSGARLAEPGEQAVDVLAHRPDAADRDEWEPAERERAGSGVLVAPSHASVPDRPQRGGRLRRLAADLTKVDLTKIAVTGEIVVGAVAVAWRLASRPGAPKAYVTMGPGGWVSMKGGSVRLAGRRCRQSPAAETSRPVWARLLRAHRIT